MSLICLITLRVILVANFDAQICWTKCGDTDMTAMNTLSIPISIDYAPKLKITRQGRK